MPEAEPRQPIQQIVSVQTSDTDPTANLPPATVSLLQPLLNRKADVFPPELPARLLPSWTVDHEVLTQAQRSAVLRHLLRLAPPELAELKKLLSC